MKSLIFRLVVASLLISSGCFTRHKDDVLPVPVVSTPFTPSGSVGIVNEVARSIKRVEVRVRVTDPTSCTVGFPHNQMRFELIHMTQPKILVKLVEPVKRNFAFIERLEDGQTYEGRIIYLPQERVLAKKTFFASQSDMDLELSLPCR
ncbi:MAG TPA: hypothetical protein VE954_31045 [Oligoflexus sp.]|uniref:hypothetical protein n=1 Tax=Oligoflexus sp. TaxID=1971216 RepID=UPI002D606628|nr:hypothetical protein [Oligoflexus sp.]HYX37562.1 hypothetical protein [Oligoflexus sp.]